MTYIYDIILNFQKPYYKFFEWLPEDKIINIPKIPIYHISEKDLTILKKYEEVQIDINFLKVKNKNQKKIMCIVANSHTAIALLFNNRGILLKRSSLIFEEEEEAILLSKNLTPITITYYKKKYHPYKNILRIEKEKKDIIISFIKNTNDIPTLKYLYYEYYQKESNNIYYLKKQLLNALSKEWNGKQKNIYNIINILISIH